jgi:hypothetical protein
MPRAHAVDPPTRQSLRPSNPHLLPLVTPQPSPTATPPISISISAATVTPHVTETLNQILNPYLDPNVRANKSPKLKIQSQIQIIDKINQIRAPKETSKFYITIYLGDNFK